MRPRSHLRERIGLRRTPAGCARAAWARRRRLPVVRARLTAWLHRPAVIADLRAAGARGGRMGGLCRPARPRRLGRGACTRSRPAPGRASRMPSVPPRSAARRGPRLPTRSRGCPRRRGGGAALERILEERRVGGADEDLARTGEARRPGLKRTELRFRIACVEEEELADLDAAVGPCAPSSTDDPTIRRPWRRWPAPRGHRRSRHGGRDPATPDLTARLYDDTLPSAVAPGRARETEPAKPGRAQAAYFEALGSSIQ